MHLKLECLLREFKLKLKLKLKLECLLRVSWSESEEAAQRNWIC